MSFGCEKKNEKQFNCNNAENLIFYRRFVRAQLSRLLGAKQWWQITMM